MNLNSEDIINLDEMFRRNMLNSLLGPKSLVLIGTISSSGVSNLAVFSQVFHIGANPPLAGILFRPDSVPRHTLTNIRETGCFTIQNVTRNYFRQAHQSSARYPDQISEFEATGLEEEYIDDFPAPFVKDATVKMALNKVEEIRLQSNDTILVVGKIERILVPMNAVEKDGFVNPLLTGSMASAGLDAYYSVQALARLSYAKPDHE
jgi:flavin reductase (DIM6/NTAB) family NADH-FMN oxidoreductase RutF